jgi:hypothetical protein
MEGLHPTHVFFVFIVDLVEPPPTFSLHTKKTSTIILYTVCLHLDNAAETLNALALICKSLSPPDNFFNLVTFCS